MPQQDALRRDFTINSLFYNINTGAIEDYTGKGLQDLRQGLIRTPLPPMETFLDGGSGWYVFVLCVLCGPTVIRTALPTMEMLLSGESWVSNAAGVYHVGFGAPLD